MSTGKGWRSSSSSVDGDGGGGSSHCNNNNANGDEDSVCSETSSQARNRINNRYSHYRRKDAPAAGKARAKPWMRDKAATTTKIKRISRVRNGSLLAEATATATQSQHEGVSSNQSVGSSASGNQMNNTSISSYSRPPVHEIQHIPFHPHNSHLQDESMLSMDEDAISMPPPPSRSVLATTAENNISTSTTETPPREAAQAPSTCESDNTGILPSVVALGDAFLARTTELAPPQPTMPAVADEPPLEETDSAASMENKNENVYEHSQEQLQDDTDDNPNADSTADEPPAKEINIQDDASAITDVTPLTEATDFTLKIGNKVILAARLATVALVSAEPEAEEVDNINRAPETKSEKKDEEDPSPKPDDYTYDHQALTNDNEQDAVDPTTPASENYNPMSANTSNNNDKEPTKKAFTSFFTAAHRADQQREIGGLVAGQGELLKDAIAEVSEDEGTVEEEEDSEKGVVEDQETNPDAPTTIPAQAVEPSTYAASREKEPQSTTVSNTQSADRPVCSSETVVPLLAAQNNEVPYAAPNGTPNESTMNNMPMDEKKEEDDTLVRRTRDLEVALEENIQNLHQAQEELSRLEEVNADLVERLQYSEQVAHAAEDAMATRSKVLEATLQVNVETIHSLQEELRRSERGIFELSQKLLVAESEGSSAKENLEIMTKARDGTQAWQSKRCRQQCRNFFRHARMSQHKSHGVKDKSPVLMTVPYHPLGPDLQGLFDTWKEMDADDTTFLFRSLDVYKKGHFYSHKLLVPWKLVISEEDQALAGSSSLSRQEFFTHAWSLVGGLKAKIGGEFEIPLFTESKIGGLVPTSDDKFVTLLHMPKVEVEEMFLEHILPYYRAVGRMMVQRIAEIAGDKNGNDRSKIAGHILPQLYRNKFFRGLEPTDELYPFEELLQHALAIQDMQCMSTEEAMSYFGVDRASCADEVIAIQHCREIIQTTCLSKYSLALQALEEGLTLNGLLDLSLCFGLMPSEMVDELVFADAQDMVVENRTGPVAGKT